MTLLIKSIIKFNTMINVLKNILAVIIIVSTQSIGFSQDLEKSYPIQRAYENNSRSTDGLPGAAYFVNFSKYDINVEFDPYNCVLDGNLKVTYFNNSKDTLNSILFKLHQNLYRKGSSRKVAIHPNDVTNGLEIQNIIIEDKTQSEIPNIFGANMNVELDNQLNPLDSIEIKISWKLHTPKHTKIRMGRYDTATHFVAYWYPQIAVYDDINGWDKDSYDGKLELYNEYADYNVNIKVPDEFIIWATGSLSNPEKVLSEDIYTKYASAFNADSIISIIDTNDLKTGDIIQNGHWNFSAQNVNDFSFALSNNYLWDMQCIPNPKDSTKKIVLHSAYSKDSEFFNQNISINKTMIEGFYTQYGIVYPYESLVCFNGDKAMEFPMMINEGNEPDLKGTVFTTSHEFTHSFFPFYVGTNQTEYAWMDEGLATMLPIDLQKQIAPDWNGPIDFQKVFTKSINAEWEVPCMINSKYVNKKGYFFHAYIRPALALYFLKDMIGENKFKESIQYFINNWNGKHPIPHDLFNSFNFIYGENLNWYFQKWFFDKSNADLGIQLTKENKIIISNIGGLPLPIYLSIEYQTGLEEHIYKDAMIWNNNSVYSFPSKGNIKSISLGNETIPDTDLSNNYLTK